MEKETVQIKLLGVEANVYMDDDEWCALVGEDLQSGRAGFGKTRQEAIDALVAEYYAAW